MDGHNWISTGEPEPEFGMLSLGLTDVLYLQMKVGEADFLGHHVSWVFHCRQTDWSQSVDA